MTSGRDALHQIDAAIAESRKRLAQASDAAASDARMLAELDQRQIAVYEALADIRLIHLQSGETNGGALGEIDRKAATLIESHDASLAGMAAARDAAAKEIDRLEAARREADAEVEKAIARHEEAAAATRARLEKDPSWLEGAARLESLTAMAARALQKLELAKDDRARKGAAYEADPLFLYLHERRFGTRDYRAFPLFALLDKWVASLISYRDHRLNYERLLEIPQRFDEHLQRLKQETDDARLALEAMERSALENDGVGKLRDAVGAARALVETLDQQIDKAEADYKALADSYASAAAGRSGPLAEARTLVAEALTKYQIPDLKVLAAGTVSQEDDRLVETLVRAKRERLEFEEARRAAVGSLDALGRRLSELEDMRRRFKVARFDSPYSEFSGRDVFALLIAEFLHGAVNRDDLWRRIERSHRTRRRDWDNDLGGDEWRGRFGLPDNWGGPLDGSWGGGAPSGPRMPRAPRPPRIPRMPSGGGRRGAGGFKTGGGF